MEHIFSQAFWATLGYLSGVALVIGLGAIAWGAFIVGRRAMLWISSAATVMWRRVAK